MTSFEKKGKLEIEENKITNKLEFVVHCLNNFDAESAAIFQEKINDDVCILKLNDENNEENSILIVMTSTQKN